MVPPMNNESSQTLFERSLKVAPGGVHSPVRAFKSVGGTPVFFEKGEGPYLWDVQGKRYIDFCQSFGPLILGHRHPKVQTEVLTMLEKAWSFGACEPYSLKLAEKITTQIPFVEKVRFVSSGTEAVMSLLRLARATTGRPLILKFNGCYHGHVDSMLVKSGSGLAGLASSDSAGVSAQVAAETLVAELDDESSIQKLFEQYKDQIAAVIVEPVPANYGLLIQRPEFLRFLREITSQNGSLLIFDEVITGFRVGPQGLAGQLDIRPDLVAYGKVLGGGFNVAAYGGRKDLMDWMAPNGPVYQAGTLSANPIGMTAGYATLTVAEETDLYTTLKTRTQSFSNALNELFKEFKAPFMVTSYESLLWIHGKTNNAIRHLGQIPAGHKENFAKLFHALLAEGVYLAPSGYEVGFMSLAHTDEILNDTLLCYKKALHQLQF